LERFQHRDKGPGLGLVALKDVHLQRESARVDEQSDLDLRVDAVSLLIPTLRRSSSLLSKCNVVTS